MATSTPHTHRHLDPEDLPEHSRVRQRRIATSSSGMVSTAHYEATRAGTVLLSEGGNAVDAAVAAAFALGVCEPAASGLGGQTMALIYMAEHNRTLALDGSSRAPNRAVPGVLEKEEQRRGYRAMTVPSTPAALAYMLRRYGTVGLDIALEPAIALAEQGFRVSALQHALTVRERPALAGGSAARFFLKSSTKPYPTGAAFRQPTLAATLRRIAENGVADFYSGDIAREIEADMIANDGLIRMDDLVRVPWPVERDPLRCRFNGTRVATFPPPGAGRTLVEMLNILNHFSPAERDMDTPQGALLVARVIRQAFADRRDLPYDPAYYPQVRHKRMLSASYAADKARALREELVTGHGETTHLSAMDGEGNAVALTQSIEKVYGACVATPSLGFLYNNYMSAFEYRDAAHPFFMRPNATPWASVAPTIIFRGRRPWMAIGSPGSDRITPSIMQVLLRLSKMDPYRAVEAPRLHCDLRDKVSLEASRMRNDVVDALRGNGYAIEERDAYSFFLGCVQLVVRDGKTLMGVADPRRDGAAEGPYS